MIYYDNYNTSLCGLCAAEQDLTFPSQGKAGMGSQKWGYGNVGLFQLNGPLSTQ